jgi:hypothetical protein
MFLFAKLKIYAALIGAALVAVVTVYYRGRADGRDTLEYEIKDDRLDKLLKAKELQDELQEMDDDDIAARAYGWVRNDNRG